MIQITNRYGTTTITQEYFRHLIGRVVTDCYGVVGMVNSDMSQSIKGLISKSILNDKGVKVKINGETLTVDLHIIVLYGVNISAIVQSIVNEVKYAVKDNTGFEVDVVNVYIDSMEN